jgi:dephospho-CoA kinase
MRVQQRSGLAKEVAENIIRQQASREERLSYADDVIFNGNDVSLDYLQEQAYNFHEKWLKISQRSGFDSI